LIFYLLLHPCPSRISLHTIFPSCVGPPPSTHIRSRCCVVCAPATIPPAWGRHPPMLRRHPSRIKMTPSPAMGHHRLPPCRAAAVPFCLHFCRHTSHTGPALPCAGPLPPTLMSSHLSANHLLSQR
jgi:hypothetical protein